MLVWIFSFIFVIGFVLCASSAIPETAEALKTFLFIVLPSVFPLCVLSDWIVRTGAFRLTGRLFAPLMKPLFGVSGTGALSIMTGLIGSYPTAAKTTAQLYKNGEITYEEALKLSAFTNNAGPLFIIGVLGTNMLRSTTLGVILWCIHVTASLLTGILMGKFYRNRHTSLNRKPIPLVEVKKQNPFLLLSSSIASAMETMIPVCGTVLFFASLCAMIEAIQMKELQSVGNLLSMFLEMTTGCQTVDKLSLTSLSEASALLTRCCLFSGVVSWGGCSVHMQTIYIFSQNGLPCSRYLIGKIFHTIIAVGLTGLVMWLYI